MKLLLTFFYCFTITIASSQNPKAGGVIAGNVLDGQSGKIIASASVIAKSLTDSLQPTIASVTNEDGEFILSQLPIGVYRLNVSAMGYSTFMMDSIHVRAERLDFNLVDLHLTTVGKDLSTVVVYTEKPLFENKDGKITFNAAESALSAGATTTELLKQTPLISVDSDGKILMKGKEVKILIDDKPVEMDARQLQDLLESMPGSMIEKIEVLTTQPPQYANERGGVINIVTKKGKVGKTGRLNANYGTRGQAGITGSYSYRRNKLAINFSSGLTYNRYRGESYSNRKNIYADSVNYFKTTGSNNSDNIRPNSRLAVDFDKDKNNLFSFTALFNSADNDGESVTSYSNINRFEKRYRYSVREIGSSNSSVNPSANLSYSRKWANPGELLRIFASAAFGINLNERNFYQQYLSPDSSRFTGNDSTQQQATDTRNRTYSLRLNYDKPLKDKKTQLNLGGFVTHDFTDNELLSSYLKKPENLMVNNKLLSNDFKFNQGVFAFRAAVRYSFTKSFFINLGVQEEYSTTSFDLVDNPNRFANNYFSTLPFANLTKKWDSGYSLTASYKRSIQRPGIRQLNPSVDYSDPYNTRFGNPFLQPYYSDNLDLAAGYWTKKFNVNISAGYNALQEIYSSIRSLQADGKTITTWQNLSGRKEYEASFFGGLNLGKKLKLNASTAFAYNVYSQFDRKMNRYRNGGSLNSTLNGNYQWNALTSIAGNFTYHKFATPQGSARNNLSMNVGLQRKFFNKNATFGINIVDPFRQQQNNNFIQAPNYNLESFSSSRSTNIIFTAAYNFKKKVKKKKK